MQNLRQVRGGRRAVDPTTELKEFDPLTGLASRPFFRFRLEEQWEQSCPNHRPLGFLLLVIDDAASLRRECSKQDWRSFLGTLGSAVSQSCQRRADFAARVRVGEIAAVLSDANEEGTRVVAERIHTALQAHEGIPSHLRLLIGGVSVMPNPSYFANALWMRANEAVEQAAEDTSSRIVVLSGLN